MSSQQAVQSELDAVLLPVLTPYGFSGAKGIYRRCIGSVIQIVEVQISADRQNFCVNLGIHLRFLPSPGQSELSEPLTMTTPSCEWQTRLAPNGAADHWWPIGNENSGTRTSISEAAKLLVEQGLPYLEGFRVFPDSFTKVSPEMIESGVTLPFPSGGTGIRRLLALSRISIETGKFAEALKFAELGLAKAGPAISLKPAFRKIIERAKPRVIR